ncbi:MAG: hypothetical protein JO235_19225 [Chroococcidiopsidaceae cyanobacterium CP_BM_RX_35]|nr:hypothetical protein [Chroococcidiopsidaceae cyanobacterium CP_BM_RX_35]
MIPDDPEVQSEEWSQEVFADNEAQALQKCELIAQEATDEGGTVVIVLGKPQQKGQTRKWICYFRSEV